MGVTTHQYCMLNGSQLNCHFQNSLSLIKLKKYHHFSGNFSFTALRVMVVIYEIGALESCQFVKHWHQLIIEMIMSFFCVDFLLCLFLLIFSP